MSCGHDHEEPESCCCHEDDADECCCDCGSGQGFRRRYLTKAEQIEELSMYLEELKLEMQAVEEKLADLRK
jgi:hypothetical protein